MKSNRRRTSRNTLPHNAFAKFFSWMRTNRWALLLITLIVLLFYHPVLKGQAPFPGDLLVGRYAPYDTNSYFGIAPGGVPNKGQGFDVIRILYPWKEFAVKSLARGELPFWNPYSFSGNPLLANFQSGVFYPFNILFFFLPLFSAWTIYIIAQSFLVFLFTYLLLREFKLSQSAAFLGGLTSAFSSYRVVWLEYGNMGHTTLWLPLILLLIEKHLRKPQARTALGIILALTLSFVAGYVQSAMYVFFFSLVFFLFRIFSLYQKDRIKKILVSLPFFILPLIIASVQFLPTLEIFFQSARSPYPSGAIVKLLIPLSHLITTFVPDFFGNPATWNYWLTGTYIERVSYIGVIPLFFIFLAFFQKQSRLFWFFAIFAGIIYFLSFNNPVSASLYSLPIPFLNTTVPTRAMTLYCFAAAVCSAFGFDWWQKHKQNRILRPLIFFAGMYGFFWLLLFLFPNIIEGLPEHSNIAKRNLLLPSAIMISLVLLLIAATRASWKKIIVILLCVLSIFDLFYFFRKITPFSPQEFFYPKTDVMQEVRRIQGIDRSWGYGSGAIDTIFQTHEEVFSTEGYDPLFIKQYGELVATSSNGKIPQILIRTDVDIAPGYGSKDLRENPYRQRILNLLGVKYILHKIDVDTKNPDTQTFPKEKYSLVWQKAPWQIYRNHEAVPRIFLTSDYRVIKDKQQIINTLLNPKFAIAKTILLQESPGIKPSSKAHPLPKLESYKNNSITIKTYAKEETLLFLSDNYYSGWKAKVDNTETKIYRADYAFRAVKVPAGNHRVVFYFDSKVFKYAMILSCLGIFLTLLFVLFNKRLYGAR